ncbi:MAG: response regulator transcription factor [Motiliproteus sp.]|nr:response regulator transcription factor [Motiliproteus sp.]MCW9052218.1 response regulator transcription factor [Motiliproteus sp.]
MRILLVEDDIDQVAYLKPELSKAGYAVEVAHDGCDAAFMIEEESFAAVVLDLGLPLKPGLQVLAEMRERGDETPVVVLTARDSWQERVDGLKAGADDYLGKPFHIEELLARVEAVIRRHFGQASQTIQHAGLALDPDRQLVTDQSGKEHSLTGIEFRLLRYLMLNSEKVISKSQLSEHVYEEEQLRDSNVIEVYINRLRQRFGKNLIETLRGQGYRLKG